MTKTELNIIFTAKVNNYLAKGYTFHLSTMGGSQSEIGKVDLTNGEEIIRILLEHTTETVEESFHFLDCYRITVGKATDWNGWGTIWNQDLEVLDQEKYYPVDYHSEYLITKEEAIAKQDKHLARYQARNYMNTAEITNPGYIKALLPYINRLNGCKSIKARHIDQVAKTTYSNGTYKIRIHITKKGHTKELLLTDKDLLKARTAA